MRIALPLVLLGACASRSTIHTHDGRTLPTVRSGTELYAVQCPLSGWRSSTYVVYADRPVIRQVVLDGRIHRDLVRRACFYQFDHDTTRPPWVPTPPLAGGGTYPPPQPPPRRHRGEAIDPTNRATRPAMSR